MRSPANNPHRREAGRDGRIVRVRRKRRSKRMLDVILLAAGLGFFIASVAYAYGCERL
jgi:hypothetical protein